MAFCGNCGRQLGEYESFCVDCGTATEQTVSVTEAEKEFFALELVALDDKKIEDIGQKIETIKTVRDVTGLGLKEAKCLVNGAPIKNLNKAEAEDLKVKLESAGFKVELNKQAVKRKNYVSAKIWNKSADTSWYSAEKTVFTINTAEQLAGLATLVNEGNCMKLKTIKLAADIILNDDSLNCNDYRDWETANPWTPIGKGNKTSFNGTFDGCGYVVSGVYINGGKRKYLGLFGCVGNFGVIKKLGVVNSFICGNSFVGGLAGEFSASEKNSGRIINCYTSNTSVIGVKGLMFPAHSVGGLIGDGYGFNLIQCYSSATVIAEMSDSKLNLGIGGLGGFSYIRANVGIKSLIALFVSAVACYYLAPVIGNIVKSIEIAADIFEIGGIFLWGFFYFCVWALLIIIIRKGWNFIDNLFFAGSRPIATNYCLGDWANLEAALWNGTHHCKIISETAMKQKSTYKDWDFANVWEIDDEINDGYPYLRK